MQLIACLTQSSGVLGTAWLFLKFSLTLWQVLCIMSEPLEHGAGIGSAFQHFGLIMQAVFSKMQTFSQHVVVDYFGKGVCNLGTGADPSNLYSGSNAFFFWVWLEVACGILDNLVLFDLADHTVTYTLWWSRNYWKAVALRVCKELKELFSKLFFFNDFFLCFYYDFF